MNVKSSDALELWGLQQYGPLDRTGFTPTTPGTCTYDRNVMIANIVEQFFELGRHRTQFRDLAKWVHGEGRTVEEFIWQRPGVPARTRLRELGWIELVGLSSRPQQEVFHVFQARFRRWWRESGVHLLLEPPIFERESVTRDEPAPLLLSTTGVADRLGKTPAAVAKLLSKGTLQGFKQDSRWVIPVACVEAYLAQEVNTTREQKQHPLSSSRTPS